MSDIIQPRVLKGFRDFLPQMEMQRACLTEILTHSFKSYGFVPIDTPVLEYAEILLGKAAGETEKQVYRFKDSGDRDVAMRFDLTVPFARFMAEHSGELYLPFKRYHIAKAWRGENTQRGRYREFVQADFDIVGADTAAADFEIISVIRNAMVALGVPDTKIHINNRGVFNRFLERLGLAEKSVEILRIVDKLAKIGADEVRRQITAIAGDGNTGEILEYIAEGDDFDATLARITRLSGGENPDSERLSTIHAMAKACGIEGSIILAPYITRGLDYYTGVVFETFLDDLPEIGSICSGGRYNDLASLYTTQKLPGVGASIGLDRLLAALEAIHRPVAVTGYCTAIIIQVEESLSVDYQVDAAALRAKGIACEVFADKRKMGQQFSYAEKKGFDWAIVRGGDEKARGIWVLKNLKTRESAEHASLDSVAEKINAASGDV